VVKIDHCRLQIRTKIFELKSVFSGLLLGMQCFYRGKSLPIRNQEIIVVMANFSMSLKLFPRRYIGGRTCIACSTIQSVWVNYREIQMPFLKEVWTVKDKEMGKSIFRAHMPRTISQPPDQLQQF